MKDLALASAQMTEKTPGALADGGHGGYSAVHGALSRVGGEANHYVGRATMGIFREYVGRQLATVARRHNRVTASDAVA